MVKAQADNTTDVVRKRKHRRAARKRRRAELTLKLSERHIVPQSELTPEEHKLAKAMVKHFIEDEMRAAERAAVGEKLDRWMAEEHYGYPAKRDRPVSTGGAATPKRINSKAWVVETVWRLNKEDKIPDKISKTELAQKVVDLIIAARTAGIPIRALTRDYIRSHLEEWIGGWPIPRN
jgi:hypothetical protein